MALALGEGLGDHPAKNLRLAGRRRKSWCHGGCIKMADDTLRDGFIGAARLCGR